MKANDLALSASGSHLLDRVNRAGVVAPCIEPCTALSMTSNVISILVTVGTNNPRMTEPPHAIRYTHQTLYLKVFLSFCQVREVQGSLPASDFEPF